MLLRLRAVLVTTLHRMLPSLTAALLVGAVWQSLPSLAGIAARPHERTLAKAANGRPTLLVAYQERDCPSYSQFIRSWRRVAENDSTNVFAVPLGAMDAPSLERVRALHPIEFPIRADLAAAMGHVMSSFRRLETPVALLLDGDGKPRLLVPGVEASARHADVEAVVVAYLNTMGKRL
jgi:hypothetical protein